MKPEFRGAVPADQVADAGPKHRGGPAVITMAVIGALLTVLMISLAGNPRQDRVLFLVLAVLVGLPTAWSWWCVIEAALHKAKLPECRYLLADDLKFIIGSRQNDVSLTAFFRPDQTAPGGATCLLVFLENHAARRRHVTLQMPAARIFGLPRARKLRLALLPGQAAVYRLPVATEPQVRAGEHELKLRAGVRNVSGPGGILPSTSGRRHRASSIAISSQLTLRPTLTVAGPVLPPGAERVADEVFLSLFVPGLAQPRFELLGMVSEYAPSQSISVPNPM